MSRPASIVAACGACLSLVFLVVFPDAGCRRAQDAVAAISLLSPAAFSGSNALREVESFVALGPRVAGTGAAERAAEYLRARLHAVSVESDLDDFLDAAPGGSNRFRNVIGRIAGGGPGLVVVMAHYDTKAGIGERFVGANDSGSGVGVLLELARVVQAGRGAAPNGRQVWPEIWLAFLDGEECRQAYGPADGLHGSRRLAQRLVDAGQSGRVKAVILLDMIGDRDLTVTIPRNTTLELASLAFKAAAAEGRRSAFSLYPGAILDDHQPFLDAGMPAVDLIDFEFGSTAKANDYWHTEADTSDKLSAASLETIGRVVIRMLNALSGN